MLIKRLTSSPTTHAIELAAQFAEQRQRVLATNLANIDTPNHQTQRLDPEAFQASLKEALDRARSTGGPSTDRLDLRGNAQFSTNPGGQVTVRPATEPAENVLFHDGTNVRLEGLMADITQNSMSYELATNLLRGRFNSLLTAIKGRVT